MKRTLFVMVAALAVLGSSVGGSRINSGNAPGCGACDQHTWSYSGTTGPEFWGTLCAPVCASGTRQSPIAIVDPVYNKALPTISYHRLTPNPALKETNYGFTPKISYSTAPETTYIQFSDSSAKYQFVELHFHSPSEHTLNGSPFEMEMHMVHTDTSNPANNVAIAVLIREGSHNPKFDNILAHLPAGDRCEAPAIPYQNVYDLLPSDRRYYTYPGSLTTPDCSETVKFVLLNGVIALSRDQMNTFRAYLKKQGFDKTNRPLQNPRGRKIETNVPR
jgi:carbonic anhydrase